jgi:hypothetical protein
VALACVAQAAGCNCGAWGLLPAAWPSASGVRWCVRCLGHCLHAAGRTLRLDSCPTPRPHLPKLGQPTSPRQPPRALPAPSGSSTAPSLVSRPAGSPRWRPGSATRQHHQQHAPGAPRASEAAALLTPQPAPSAGLALLPTHPLPPMCRHNRQPHMARPEPRAGIHRQGTLHRGRRARADHCQVPGVLHTDGCHHGAARLCRRAR